MPDDTLLSKIHSAVIGMTGDVGGIKSDVKNVKEDVKEMRLDLRDLQRGFDSCDARKGWSGLKETIKKIEAEPKKTSSNSIVPMPRLINGWISIGHIKTLAKAIIIMLFGVAIGAGIITMMFSGM